MRSNITRPATARAGARVTISQLRRLELFADLSPAALGDLAGMFRTFAARPGQALEVQDAPVRWWTIVVSGHALVVRDGTPLGLLGQGESWCEHSLLSHQRSPISVVALSPVKVLAITDRQFDGLLECNSPLRARIMERSATSADRLALPVYRALLHMHKAEEAQQRAALAGIGVRW